MIAQKSKRILLLCCLLLAFLTGCTLSLQEYLSEADQIPTGNYDRLQGQLNTKPTSAEKYYEAISKVINQVDVISSDAVHTEAEAIAFFNRRGFSQYPVTSEFTINGDVTADSEMSSESQGKHPLYTTYFLSEDGKLWTILDMNGRIFANPVFFNLSSTLDVQVYVSETDSIISYDGMENRYYETIPHADTVRVKVVDRIDAETLNGLTEEELNNK